MKPKQIDIIITTYNRKYRLLQTLGILANQTCMDFNLIINDDGGTQTIDPSQYPIISKYIWNEDTAYHRVGRFNESAKLCVSPYIIMLDDDCIPNSHTFVAAYIALLTTNDVCRGIVQFPDGGRATSWFSTANLGLRKKVINEIGLFDEGFDGYYGHEDRDLGIRIEKGGYSIVWGGEETRTNHGAELYADGDRSPAITGHNTEFFINKWGFHPKHG